MGYGRKITLILELPHLIPVQWRREKKYSICGNLRRALNKLVPLPVEIVEGHTNHTKSQIFCLQNVKKKKNFCRVYKAHWDFLPKFLSLYYHTTMEGVLGVQRSGQDQETIKKVWKFLIKKNSTVKI